jgi:hypothetical protein
MHQQLIRTEALELIAVPAVDDTKEPEVFCEAIANKASDLAIASGKSEADAAAIWFATYERVYDALIDAPLLEDVRLG